MKVRGHDKGHQRSKSQIGIGSWISSEFDYRHIVELKSKFWCTIGHHLVLFQFWPNLLHKIVILATLHLIFSQKMDVWLETKGCSLLHTLCQAFWANKPNFLVWFKMTKGWPYVKYRHRFWGSDFSDLIILLKYVPYPSEAIRTLIFWEAAKPTLGWVNENNFQKWCHQLKPCGSRS